MDPVVGSYDIGGSVGTLFADFLDPTTGTYDIDGATGSLSPNPWVTPTPTVPTAGGSRTPPAAPAPSAPAVGQPIIRHHAERMDAPALNANGYPQDWTATETIDDPLGTMQIIVEGVDVTTWGGIPTPMPDYALTEPFGYQAAFLDFPQLSVFTPLPAWAKHGANVEIRLVPLEGEPETIWRGILISDARAEPDGQFGFDCIGELFQADMQLRPPAFDTTPLDVGVVIARVLNSTIGRRFADTPEVFTGIITSVLGSWEPRLTGFVQRLLATAITNGQQWTVMLDDGVPTVRLKDTTTRQWSVYVGQRGINVSVDLDSSQTYNALYAQGIAPDGGRWMNARYPNWHPDDTPPYPYANPATVIRVGRTDAQTDTGNGVSVWQAKAAQPVTGAFSQADAARLRSMQTQAGITVDGVLGPQSWAMTFDTGANTGDLTGAFIAPLAYLPAVEPRLYGPSGDDLGPNPDFDEDVLRIEQKIDFGAGVDITEGRRAAEEMLARDSSPGLVGTVEFELDPPEISRFLLRPGLNGLVRGLHGQDVQVHVVSIDQRGGTVTAVVDEKARDYPTLDAIRDRDRNATDPAKAAVTRLVDGIVATDRPVFDADSPAGIVPHHAIYKNLWDVRRIPFGSYGSIARTEITTSGPARAFALAVFGKPITAAELLALVGNPLTATTNPWEEDLPGLLQAWGWKSQPCGYYPKTFTNPDGDTAAPVTGRLVDDAGWDYASAASPWLWVATIASGATYVEGRFFPGAS